VDVTPVWTPDQIAGLIFGAFMIAVVASGGKVDEAIARSQRRQLGLCERCGGVNEPGSCPEAGCPLRDKDVPRIPGI